MAALHQDREVCASYQEIHCSRARAGHRCSFRLPSFAYKISSGRRGVTREPLPSRRLALSSSQPAGRVTVRDPAMQKRSSKKGTNGVGEPKKARTTAMVKTEHAEEEEEIFNVFSLEMDTLECDICFLPFESQVYSGLSDGYQCKNGHAACANCCISMHRKCPSCNEPIGDFRCRATEKILAGMTRPCRFKKHGCTETVWYTEARAHEEESCRFAPYSCPFDGCAYRGCLLSSHIEDGHELCRGGTTFFPGLVCSYTVTLQKSTPFRALLHPNEEGVFLLLNGGDVLTGRSLSLVCVGPYAAELDEEYDMKVEAEEQWSLSASGKLQFVRQLQGYKAKRFLFIPDDFWGSSGSITVTVFLLPKVR